MIRKLIVCCLFFGFVFILKAQSPIPKVPRTVQFADLTLQLNDAAIAEIQADVNAIRSSDHYFGIKLDRVNLYFPIIERIFREEGLPEDFKYLVIQESGLVSDAVSTSDAVGFWQFKDFTAREVGMRVDSQVDERKNIVSSTKGAATYLKRNNAQLYNWAYAMSAYQAGMGGVRKYLNEKYFGAKKMPVTKESHWYLKKFIAHKIAFEREIGAAHSEGLELKEYKNGAGKDLNKIAAELKIEEDLLRQYNKWLLKGKVPDDKPYVIIVPVYGKIKEELLSDQSDEDPKISQKIVTPEVKKYPNTISPISIGGNTVAVGLTLNGLKAVVAGEMDQFASLAADGNIPLNKLLKFNDLSENDKIKKGQVYYLQNKKSKSAIGFHVVQPGETVWSIGQRYGIREKKLRLKNRMDDHEQVKVGRVMWLNSNRPKSVAVEYHELNTVTPEILVSNPLRLDKPIERFSQPVTIAKPIDSTTIKPAKYEEVYIEELEAANDTIAKVKEQAPPQRVEKPKQQTLPQSNKTHTVAAGETFWGISRKYEITVNQLLEWNNLNQSDPLSVGKTLVVSQGDESVLPDAKPKIRSVINYEVQKGDTFYSIAKKFEASVGELMELNNRTNGALSIGEVIKVYGK